MSIARGSRRPGVYHEPASSYNDAPSYRGQRLYKVKRKPVKRIKKDPRVEFVSF